MARTITTHQLNALAGLEWAGRAADAPALAAELVRAGIEPAADVGAVLRALARRGLVSADPDRAGRYLLGARGRRLALGHASGLPEAAAARRRASEHAEAMLEVARSLAGR